MLPLPTSGWYDWALTDVDVITSAATPILIMIFFTATIVCLLFSMRAMTRVTRATARLAKRQIKQPPRRFADVPE